MTPDDFKNLRENLNLSVSDCARLIGSGIRAADVEGWEAGRQILPDPAARRLAYLDAQVEAEVIAMVDDYSDTDDRDVVLIRFLGDADLALYEPDLFDKLGSAGIHGVLVARAKRAIERIGGEVTVAFMDSEFYEAWLGVNDFDDSRDLRIAWARQQMRGLSGPKPGSTSQT